MPYVKIHTNKGPLKFLIDTGANRNYISPKHVNWDRCRDTHPVKIKNVNGDHIATKFVEFNPFYQIHGSSKQEFLVFDFHEFFDGLIGYNTLRSSKADILTADNLLKFPNGTIQMYRKYPNSTTIQLNCHETKVISLPTDVTEGEFYFENDIPLSPQINIHAGLYSCTENRVFVTVTNVSDEQAKVVIRDPLTVEINNFTTDEPVPVENFRDPTTRVFDQLRLDHLNREEKTNLLKLIADYEHIFHVEGQQLTFTNAVKHRINTKDDVPIHVKSYRYPFSHREEVQRQISKMLDQGIIRPSNSPWTSPVWIVPKKLDATGQKKWRLVIDYRKLNEKTIDDRYPIPNITDILDKLGRCMYFTTLDLASGFHQIEVDSRDIAKTAFNVENGHYEFLRMPFGLKNAPSTFQRVMDNVLREHIGVRCLVYMDDIIVFSTSLKEHLDNLRKIFETLRKYNMKIQLDKSEFLKKEVAFLGHIVTRDGVQPNPDKIETIRKWPIPTDEKQLRGFLGILGYYRKFIKDFAKIAKPLTQALRKGEKIIHNKEFVEAFERCRNILTSSDILQYPEFDKPFVLTTDASNYAVGAVLSQGKIGSDKPIAFASRTLNKSEENYSAIEKELLAIVWACKYFRPYLYGRKFTLYTDHKPLTHGLNLKDTNSRLIHWRLYLEEFDFEIQYRPGRQNVVADGLSRVRETEMNVNDASDAPSSSDTEDDSSENDETVHSADTDDSAFIPCTEHPLNKFSNQIVLQIGADEGETYEEVFPRMFRRTITKINFGVPNLIKMFKNYMDVKRSNCIFCPESVINSLQIVYKNYFSRGKPFKVCISQKLLIDLKTPEEQNLVIEQTHSNGHRGIWENNRKIAIRYFFPAMKSKIQQYVRLCRVCNSSKYERHPYKIKLGKTPNPKKPLEIVHVDIFIKKPNIFLSFVDKFSRFGTVIPIKSRNINDVRNGLTKYFTLIGTPNLIVSDNEPAIRSIEIRTLLENLNVQIHFTPPNHSVSNGTVERFHSTLGEIYRCLKPTYPDLNDKELFRIACTTYNNTVHSAVKLKPREIMYARRDEDEMSLDIDKIIENRNKFFQEVVSRSEATKNKNLKYHNRAREEPPVLPVEGTVYNKVQGVRNKGRERYLPVTVVEDKGRTFTDHYGRELHKDNIRRT